MIQSLVHTVDLHPDQMLLLDTFRVKRNAIDYTGDDVDEASVDECIRSADNLWNCVTEWLSITNQSCWTKNRSLSMLTITFFWTRSISLT